MKRFFVFYLAVFFISCQASGQFNIYSALTIPDSLKNNADVVVREENRKFTIKDINSAKYEVHQVITILNEDAKEYLSFYYRHAQHKNPFTHGANTRLQVITI